MLARTSVRTLGAMALVALLALAVGFLSQSTANAQCPVGNCEEVDTAAIVGSGTGGQPMTIECKWELPDTSELDLAMTYGQDDTPSVLADPPICQPGVAAVDGRRHMIGLLPNEDDDPIQRQYEKWVAVESANVGDIVNVYWKVWEPYVAAAPNGPNCASPVEFPPDATLYCFKYQHHATADLGPPTLANPLGGGGTLFSYATGTCDELQAMTDMFGAAVATGQMSQAEVDYIIDKCWQGEKAIFRVRETVSKEQSYGEYRVEASIINGAGTAFRNVNYFDVLPFIYINKDFSLVDWQTILNNSTTIVSGDLVMETEGPAYADGSGVAPTVENTGNQEMYVWTHFNPLVLQSDNTKKILHFDSRFRAQWQPISLIQVIADQYASEWYCYDQHPLGSNQVGKLDLSVHPENAEAGTYLGDVHVLGVGGSCGPAPTWP